MVVVSKDDAATSTAPAAITTRSRTDLFLRFRSSFNHQARGSDDDRLILFNDGHGPKRATNPSHHLQHHHHRQYMPLETTIIDIDASQSQLRDWENWQRRIEEIMRYLGDIEKSISRLSEEYRHEYGAQINFSQQPRRHKSLQYQAHHRTTADIISHQIAGIMAICQQKISNLAGYLDSAVLGKQARLLRSNAIQAMSTKYANAGVRLRLVQKDYAKRLLLTNDAHADSTTASPNQTEIGTSAIALLAAKGTAIRINIDDKDRTNPFIPSPDTHIKSRSGIGSPLHSLQIIHREEGHFHQDQRQQQQQQIFLHEHQIAPEHLQADRAAELDRIAESVEQIAGIYRHLCVMVAEQGALVDRIDYNLERTSRNIERGNQQLELNLNNQMEMSVWRRWTSFILFFIAVLFMGGLLVL